MKIECDAVLFDLDNTVYAYDICHQSGLCAAYQASLRIGSLFSSQEEFDKAYHEGRSSAKKYLAGKAASHCRLLYFKKLIEKVYGKTRQNETLLLHEAYWDGYFQGMICEPGSREVLEGLRGKGIRTAWVTNFTTERQFRKLDYLGLVDAVDFLVTSEEVDSEKPSPEGIRLALRNLGISPSPRVILVGDSETEDGGAASEAGVGFVWYRRKHGESKGRFAPTSIVESWQQLGELLI